MKRHPPATHELIVPLQAALAGLAVGDPPARGPDKPPAPRPQPATEKADDTTRALAGLAAAAQTLKVRHERDLHELQRVAVELAVAVASRLVHGRITANEFPVEELVRKAVARLAGEPRVVVRLHPEDLALLKKRLGGQTPTPAGAEVQLAADPTVGRGDCRAEGGPVVVLSRLEAQLADIRERLLETIPCSA